MISSRQEQDIRETIEDVLGFEVWEMSDLDINNFVEKVYKSHIPKPILKRWLHDTRRSESRWIVSGSEGVLAAFMNLGDAVSYIEMKTEALQFERISVEDVHEYF
jgi:hypothetical protein